MSEETVQRLVAALLREPTNEERHAHEVSFASYRAFLAGVEWGAKHGRGEWDDSSQAWADWAEKDAVDHRSVDGEGGRVS